MNLFVQVVLVTLLVYLRDCTADCNDFRKQCTSHCLEKVGGVETNQCWGSPTYRFCTCSDKTVYSVPGYTCDHPECPKDRVVDGTTKKPIQRQTKPIHRTTPAPSSSKPVDPELHQLALSVINGCKDFRDQCASVCFDVGGIENNQCWGSPKYRQCKCVDNMVRLIGDYDCEHPDCRDCALDLGFGSCKQSSKNKKPAKRPINRKRRPIRRKNPLRVSSSKPVAPELHQVAINVINGCKDFRDQCASICHAVGGVESDQCWGSPKYRQCKCVDNIVRLIGDYDCEHPDCVDCALDLGFGSCKQSNRATILATILNDN